LRVGGEVERSGTRPYTCHRSPKKPPYVECMTPFTLDKRFPSSETTSVPGRPSENPPFPPSSVTCGLCLVNVLYRGWSRTRFPPSSYLSYLFRDQGPLAPCLRCQALPCAAPPACDLQIDPSGTDSGPPRSSIASISSGLTSP